MTSTVRPSVEEVALGPAGSGEVAHQRPRRYPAGAQPAGPVDDGALLVVADAQAVVEDGDLPDGGEQPPQQRRVDVDGDGLPVAGRGRAPVPEVVGAAVRRRQAVAGPVP